MPRKLPRYSRIVLIAAFAFMLNACSPDESVKSEQTQGTVNGEKIAANEGPATEAQKPEHLPSDFPLPADADIRTSHSAAADGKKSVMMVFATKESMETVSGMYREFFRSQNISEDGQTLDDRNLIIQGENDKESWSLIGGPLSSEEGVIELTLTWTEL
ncbi:hypothetical protein [Fontibacillus sp. BL9]|uniref:hypothetical protein n=1 Tax=Fontibacillus sp. BL9 TaxID=3389971 RepID=UPI00397DF8B0